MIGERRFLVEVAEIVNVVSDKPFQYGKAVGGVLLAATYDAHQTELWKTEFLRGLLDGVNEPTALVRLGATALQRLARAMVVADDEGLAMDEQTAAAIGAAIRATDPEWSAPWSDRIPGFRQNDDKEGGNDGTGD